MKIFSQVDKDTILLKEVVLIGEQKKQEKKTSNLIEEYLEKEAGIGLIKRGTYGWEPILNNMLSERSVVTIDGMRIFGACTDKMDPATSYVETSNISQIEVEMGQQGAKHGSTIAGSINLKRKRGYFVASPNFYTEIQNGYQSNDNARFYLLQSGINSKKIWATISASYRKADNYKSGKANVVKYSGFEKYNAGIDIGFKIKENRILKTDFIFDKATNIGYPALPMDVSLAQTYIFSLGYKHIFNSDFLKNWETKIYANSITHTMDDTKREENDKLPVHMDMPGWSDTYGVYTTLRFGFNRLESDLKLSGYTNRRTAEMTMYYNNGRKMFMYTWPKVRISEGALTSSHKYNITENKQLNFSFGTSFSFTNVESEIGLNANRTFFPHIQKKKYRFLPNVGLFYTHFLEKLTFNAGVGYSHRNPSISETYGFYLFNSFDGYDYIGNPELKNEISHEINLSAMYKHKRITIEGKTMFFYIKNYIMGEIIGQKSWQMTPLNNKNGVKIYKSFNYAYQLNSSFSVSYNISNSFFWKNTIGYALGKDNFGENLPFIRPFYYQSSLKLQKGNFWGNFSVEGDFEQTAFRPDYGEDQTPAYTIANLLVGWNYKIFNNKISLQAGIENIFDRLYSTYADWNNFPRKGRNITLGMEYRL